MKRPIATSAAFAFLLFAECILAQTSAPASRPRRERGPSYGDREIAGTIEYGDAPSKLMASSVRYGVYLPPGYKDSANATTRYPVVFFLHGLFESAERWFNRGGGYLFDQAVKEKKLPPVILIVPSAGFSFYSDSLDGKTPYARFFIEEFVPWVDVTFRTKKGREGRLIAGNSMGGFGALKFAFTRPDLFSAVGVHSPAILPENPEDASARAQRTIGFLRDRRVLEQLFGEPIDLDKWKAANPLSLAGTAKLDPSIGIYVDCGEDDEYEFDEGCRALKAALDKRRIPHQFAIRDGDHGWGYIRASLPHLIEFFAKHLKAQKP
jgi:S-formylglutathione hydrolase FrmB